MTNASVVNLSLLTSRASRVSALLSTALDSDPNSKRTADSDSEPLIDADANLSIASIAATNSSIVDLPLLTGRASRANALVSTTLDSDPNSKRTADSDSDSKPTTAVAYTIACIASTNAFIADIPLLTDRASRAGVLDSDSDSKPTADSNSESKLMAEPPSSVAIADDTHIDTVTTTFADDHLTTGRHANYLTGRAFRTRVHSSRRSSTPAPGPSRRPTPTPSRRPSLPPRSPTPSP